ncbi:hypothetical protein [Labilibaculum euxinus]
MKKLYLILSLVLFSFIANASITGQAEGLCPNDSYWYKCNYQNDDLYEWVWTVKGGTINNGSTYSDAWVSWNDTNEEHYVRVRTYRIAYDNDGNKTLHEIGDSKKIVRVMSLKDVLPAGFTKGDFSINPGDNTPVTYTIPLLYYPECYENIEKPVNDYEWIIPAGWEYNGTISDGTTPIKTHNISITVIPDNCTGGKIKVRGVPECTGQSKSEYRSKTIIRSDNNIVSSISTTVCGKPKEITLNIGSVPNAIYQWTKPASWTWTSGTNSNVVKVMPDGLSGGAISVIVNGCISLKESKTITLKDWDSIEPIPKITGAKVLCTGGGTYSLQNAYSNTTTITWSASPASLFYGSISGSGTSAFLKAKSSTVSGAAEIKFILRNQCGGVHEVKYDVWVGKPELDGNISGSSSVSCNSMHIYDYLGMIEGESSTRWVVGLQFNDISNSNGYQLFVSPINNGDGYVTFVASNSCGEDILCKPVSVSGWDCEYGVINRPSRYSCGGSGGMYMAIFPNPANEYTELNLYSSNELSDVQKNSKSTISIPYNELSQNMDEYEIQIWHESKGLVKQMKSCDKRLQIRTNNLPEGTYFLLVFINGEVHKQQLIIKR